jgi:signal transduction histidine kinase/ActR/RegA family two-component response regulator
VARIDLPAPAEQSSITRALELQEAARAGPVMPGSTFTSASMPEQRPPRSSTPAAGGAQSWAALHVKMLELVAPPSILIDREQEILHRSPDAGRFLQYGGGEPSRNLLHAIHPALRIELRAAIHQAAQTRDRVEVAPISIDIVGQPLVVRPVVMPIPELDSGAMLVILEAVPHGASHVPPPPSPAPREGDPLDLLRAEIERLKFHLADTVEQYEASTGELNASNEELRAMNEELRAATEEIETSREELQSINEERGRGDLGLRKRLVHGIVRPRARYRSVICETALAEGRASDERWHRRKDGGQFWTSGTLMPMRDGPGEIVGFVKILRDQSVQRRSREDLAASRADLVDALVENRRARSLRGAADLAKDRFLAVLSHELRNPLASIDAVTAALFREDRISGAERERAGDILRRQVDAMRRLLDDLLDVSRLRFGGLVLQKAYCELAPIVDAALEPARPVIDKRRHALQITLPPDPVMLFVDASRVSQALSHLLINAAKYTREGGHIALRARVEGGRCIIDVVDDGKGLDEETNESMFEMFWHSDEVDATETQSMGIGLALVRTVAQLHDGIISAASDGPGHGSTFTMNLPLPSEQATAVEAPAPTRHIAPTTASSPHESPCRVLVVDDIEDLGWAQGAVLQAAGYDVRIASNGSDALALAAEFAPDVAVLDLGMPSMSGFELARRLRGTPPGERMLLVAATGWGSETDHQASERAGFDAHLVKPVIFEELRALIDRWAATAARPASRRD